jgi:hypothetical protein
LQVNIRLDPSDADVLAAVAFLNDCSAAEVVRPLLKGFLDEQRLDPEVLAAIQARQRRHAASR